MTVTDTIDRPDKRVSDVAERIGMSELFVRQEVAAGRLGHTRLGRLIRFTEDDIREYLQAAHRPAKNVA